MEPLGLLYIKKALMNAGHYVEIYDSTASGKIKKIKTPQEFQYLEKYYFEDSSLFSLHSRYIRFGDSFSKITHHCVNNTFDIIGISSLFSAYHPEVELLVSEIKKVVKTPVVIGGTAINSLNDEDFEKSESDYMIKGCGTESMPLLVEAFLGNIGFSDVPGLIYKINEKIKHNEPSTQPPWYDEIIPQREKVRFFRKRKSAPTIFSTGCRNKCSFCTIHIDNKIHSRKIDKIKEELRYLLETGIENLDIEDDDLFSDHSFTVEILNLLKEFHLSGMTFTAMNGITAKNITPFAHLLADSGFIKLDLSLVCGSKSASSEIKRPHNISDLETIIKAVDGKIEIEVFLIPGISGTTLKETLSTMIYLHKLKIKCGLSPLYLVPGVSMFKDLVPENLRLCRGSALYPFSEKERDNVASLLKISRFLNCTLSNRNNDEFNENLTFFLKSIKRKQWFRKTKDGKWLDSFSFSEDFEIVSSHLKLD